MDILKISKAIGTHISVMVLIAASTFMYFKEDITTLYTEMKDAKQKELEASVQKEKEAFFQQQLVSYLNNSSSIDQGLQIACDDEYMKEYRKARAALKALEGAAKTASVYNEYLDFFKSQNSLSMQVVMQCKD